MISNVELKNIKCFSNVKFNFSNVTVFCGANSAGKSTALQALLLLRQNHNCNKLASGKLSLVGEYFSVGHVRDLISHSPIGEFLSISIDDLCFSSNLKKAKADEYYIELDSTPNLSHDFFSSDFHYLSAYRLSPQNSYDTNFETDNFDLGIYGQFAISALVRYGDMPAPNINLARKICSAPDDEPERPISLSVAFKEAMKLISSDFDIVANSHLNLDKVSNTFSAGATANQVRPVNTGFGISNVIPIVLGALCTRESGYLIVENPEVHLHPAAQSALASFLALAATCGVQVILETHSDHIVNGIRVFVKENKISSQFVTINSVRATKSGRITTEILISDDGGLSDTDEGFFDQAEKDLLRLF